MILEETIGVDMRPLENMLEPESRRKWPGVLLLILSVAGASLLAIYLVEHVAELEGFIARMGVAGPLVSIALQTVFGASPIPTEPLTLINGAIFGPLRGTLYSWIGYMLAAYIEYYIGLNIRHAADFESRRDKLPFGLGRFPANSPWFLMLARVIPGYGPKMVGLMGGIYHIPLWRYTWTAAIPNLVGALVFSYGGFGLRALMLGRILGAG
jgi:uncharacterized membrane protein YdjX (TVP38/TMEM64 family)